MTDIDFISFNPLRKSARELDENNILVEAGPNATDATHKFLDGAPGVVENYFDNNEKGKLQEISVLVRNWKGKCLWCAYGVNRFAVDACEDQEDAFEKLRERKEAPKKVPNKTPEAESKESILKTIKEQWSMGTRVTRGPKWTWGDQGGEGGVATIVGIPYYSSEGNIWVNVEWDDGSRNGYMVYHPPTTKRIDEHTFEDHDLAKFTEVKAEDEDEDGCCRECGDELCDDCGECAGECGECEC